MISLLDASVMIALIDPAHVAHEVAQRWFVDEGSSSWATCPLTENAAIRIVGHPKYTNSPGSPGVVAMFVTRLKTLRGHQFWPDAISLCDSPLVDVRRLTSSKDVTDTYLLTLAVSKGGVLATFDRKMSTNAVKGGKAALRVIA